MPDAKSEAPTPVRCACGTLFGYSTGDTLAIKNRDLFRVFRGGSVSGPCRKCGVVVRWEAKTPT